MWYGAVRSYGFFHEVKDTAPQEIKFVQSKKVVALPIVGSVVLLLLFFFLDLSITIYILVSLISLVVLISQFFIFAPLADYIFDKLLSKGPKGFTVPKIGFIPISGIVLFLYSVGVVLLWIFTGHWFVVDGIAWCMGITQMCILRLPNLKISTLLLVPFLIYDVFWVFISPLLFHGTSIMVSVAVRLPPFPLLLKVPHFANPGDFSGLGLGDIVLPGFFVVFLYSFDEHLQKRDFYDSSNWRNSYVSYFTLSLIEYTVGYILTITVGTLMEAGQPALLYLVPCILGTTAYVAWRRGELRLMWEGQHNLSNDVESQNLLKGENDNKGNESNNNDNDEAIGTELVVNLGPLDPREIAATDLADSSSHTSSHTSSRTSSNTSSNSSSHTSSRDSSSAGPTGPGKDEKGSFTEVVV